MIPNRLTRRVFVLLFVGLLLLLIVMPAAALTATPVPTPVPTATHVPLNIPTNTIMSSTNDWIAQFAPVAAISIGIGLALAVLGFLGRMIRGAFQ